MKLYLRPSGKEIEPATGIGRVVIAQLKYLPDYGIEVVDDIDAADIVACHTTDFGLSRPPDILHCHGLYWTADPGGVYSGFNDAANSRIIAAIRRAKIVTVPSEWVAMPFKRDMRISPDVIGHGIDFDDWKPGKNEGFILWNKNRPNDVCDPRPAWELAQRGLPVQSTFAPSGVSIPANMKVTNRVPFERMKSMIETADVYLATAQETFGIGTLEAMACGVPILGYAWAGTLDIVEHQVHGYLVQPGDIEGLLDGYEYIQQHRAQMKAECREQARLFDWPSMIAKYAAVYERAVQPEPQGVTVVIPCYNYAKFVGEAIESCLKQTRKPERIIVIDDGSKDGSREVIDRYGGYVDIVHQQNQGVSAARNKGIEMATTPYIVCLDADDRLAPLFLETTLKAAEKDRGMGIAYTGLGIIHGEGRAQGYTAWPPEFTWEAQATPHTPPSNCIPSACLFRRDMWERAGGYRQAYKPGEDAEFWTRGLSVGFTAKKISDQPLFEYRVHQKSASRNNPYRAIDDWLPWMRDKQYPLGAPSIVAPKVKSYLQPLVSVIIPCGPGHSKYLPTALESLTGQTFRDWEAIVIQDNVGEDDDFKAALKRYPFVRQYTTYGRMGAGWARNIGIEQAKAPLVLFLDADDWLHPGALLAMVDAWRKSEGEFIYTDWQTDAGEKKTAPEYDTTLYQEALFHPVTVLMTKEQAGIVGNFDKDLEALEDYDFFLKCATNGIHGKRASGHFLTYRLNSGTRRKNTDFDKMRAEILGRYTEYFTGVKTMPGCCGGQKAAQAILAAKRAIGDLPAETAAPMTTAGAPSPAGTIRIEYYGPRTGAVTYTGKSGKSYRFGNTTLNRYGDVEAQDAALFLSMEYFREVKRVIVPSVPMEIVDPEPEAIPEAASELVTPEPEPVAVQAEPVKRKYTKKAK